MYVYSKHGRRQAHLSIGIADGIPLSIHVPEPTMTLTRRNRGREWKH